MEIVKTHHIDASEPDENGLHDYYYEYDIYAFSEDGVSYVARRYTDEPEIAHFLKMRTGQDWRLLEASDFNTAMFAEATACLRQEGAKQIQVLGKLGYFPV